MQSLATLFFPVRVDFLQGDLTGVLSFQGPRLPPHGVLNPEAGLGEAGKTASQQVRVHREPGKPSGFCRGLPFRKMCCRPLQRPAE